MSIGHNAPIAISSKWIIFVHEASEKYVVEETQQDTNNFIGRKINDERKEDNFPMWQSKNYFMVEPCYTIVINLRGAKLRLNWIINWFNKMFFICYCFVFVTEYYQFDNFTISNDCRRNLAINVSMMFSFFLDDISRLKLKNDKQTAALP